MILLSGQTLTAKTRFQPVSVALNLAERSSTATMVIGPEAPELSVGNWLKENAAGPGEGIIWRVKSIDRGIETGTRTCQLEHIVNTLRDYIIFGEVRAKDITGVAKDTDCTAKQAANYVLREYPLKTDAIQLWQLGNLASAYNNIKNPYHFDGETLFEAMETISGSLEDCFWTYNLTALPFTLNLTKLSDTVSSEMRMSRNIQSMRVTVDRSQMYTRLYAIGKNDMRLEEVRNSAGALVYPAKYHENNVSKYGIIAKIETDQSIDSQSELRSWAKALVKKHSQPTVTVTISGLDLSEATGESLDKFTLGKICRVPLPDLGETFNERVVKLAYADTVSEPERVTVTLANELRDVAKILNEQSSSGRRSSRAGVKSQGEDHAWIVDDDYHIQLVAEAVAGKGEDGFDWSRVSSLEVGPDGICGEVTAVKGDVKDHGTRIKQTENEISLVVEKRGDDGYMIKAAEICTAINDAGEGEAIIDADHVYISGDTTISGMLTVDGEGALKVLKNAVFAGKIEMTGTKKDDNYIHTRRIQLYESGDIQVTGSQAGEHYEITGDDLTGFIRALQLDKNGTTITLQYQDKRHGDTWQDAGSFKRATSLSGEWSGSGKLTVSANADNVPAYVRLLASGAKENEDGTPYTSGNTWYVPINAVWGSSGQESEPTGFRTFVDATGIYNGVTVDNFEALDTPVTQTDESPRIRANLTNGKRDSATMDLSVDTYYRTGYVQPQWCVNLKYNNVLFGRIDVMEVYRDGAASASDVTVDSFEAQDVIIGQTTDTTPRLKAIASNGNSKIAGLTLVGQDENHNPKHFTPEGYSTQHPCVELYYGTDLFGRIDTISHYNEGYGAVNIDRFEALDVITGQTVDTTPRLKVYTNSGKTSIAGLTLVGEDENHNPKHFSPQGYSVQHPCVELYYGEDLFGRIDTYSHYTEGAGSVYVGSFSALDIITGIRSNEVDTTPRIRANVSNGTNSTAEMLLEEGYYYPAGFSEKQYCVNLKYGNDIFGRIDVMDVYRLGVASASNVTVDYFEALDIITGQTTDTTPRLKAYASNGNSKIAGLTLVGLDDNNKPKHFTPQGYSTQHTCVELYYGEDLFGRVDTYSHYNEGYNAVKVSSFEALDIITGTHSNDEDTTPRIKAIAANGESKIAGMTLERGKTFLPSGSTTAHRCVNLKYGDDIFGRIDVQPDYTAGFNAVGIDSFEALDIITGTHSNDVDTTPRLRAVAQSGKTKIAGMTLERGKTFLPSGSTTAHRCVNLKYGDDIFGRIDVQPDYTDGAASVSVSRFEALDAITGQTEDTTPRLKAYASNGDSKIAGLTLDASKKFSPAGATMQHPCVELKYGSTLFGRIDTISHYNEGHDAGYKVTTSEIVIPTSSVMLKSTVGTSTTGMKSVGVKFRKSQVIAPGYLFFNVQVHGTTKKYYLEFTT